MNSSNVGFHLALAETEIKDPGASGTLSVDKSLAVCNLVSAGAEARTLPLPVKEGIEIALFARTIAGTITLTVTGGLDLAGTTTFAFTAVNQFLMLKSFRKADGTLIWLKFADYETGSLSPTELGFLDGVTAGTGAASKALVLDSNGNVTMPAAPAAIDERNAEIVITTNVILAAENGRTYYLTLATGFTSTLPVPALGLHFRFKVAIAPTTAYIITTNASANILYGMTEERAGTAGVAGAAKNTFNFVANQAKIGDWVEFYSDGTNWYYHGMTDIAAGNTVA